MTDYNVEQRIEGLKSEFLRLRNEAKSPNPIFAADTTSLNHLREEYLSIKDSAIGDKGLTRLVDVLIDETTRLQAIHHLKNADYNLLLAFSNLEKYLEFLDVMHNLETSVSNLINRVPANADKKLISAVESLKKYSEKDCKMLIEQDIRVLSFDSASHYRSALHYLEQVRNNKWLGHTLGIDDRTGNFCLIETKTRPEWFGYSVKKDGELIYLTKSEVEQSLDINRYMYNISREKKPEEELKKDFAEIKKMIERNEHLTSILSQNTPKK